MCIDVLTQSEILLLLYCLKGSRQIAFPRDTTNVCAPRSDVIRNTLVYYNNIGSHRPRSTYLCIPCIWYTNVVRCNSAGPDLEIKSHTRPSAIHVIHTVRLVGCAAHVCKRISPRQLIAVSASATTSVGRYTCVLLYLSILCIYVCQRKQIKQNGALTDTIALKCSRCSSPANLPGMDRVYTWYYIILFL